MPFLNLKSEPDPDDLAMEGSVTKQFWKNLYQNFYYAR